MNKSEISWNTPQGSQELITTDSIEGVARLLAKHISGYDKVTFIADHRAAANGNTQLDLIKNSTNKKFIRLIPKIKILTLA
jgi:hypothetical protein